MQGKTIKTLLFLLLSSVLFANSYPHFTKDELLLLEKNSGVISKNRASDYQETIASYKNLDRSQQLNRINFYLNQLLPQYDDVMQKTEDYWATPKEFLTAGFGDCEDYVIIKYFTLLKLGFDKEKLFMTTVHETYSGGYHMVLTYFEKNAKAPLVLDNLSFRILDLKAREDLKADLFINTDGIFKIDDNYKLQKVQNYSPKFQELLTRVKKNN